MLAGIAAACGMAAAVTGPPAAPGRPVASIRLAAAARLDAGGGGRVGLSTVGLGGWQVQTSAATTSWTNGVGATQDGNQISEPGFAAAGWLPVTPDSAGAVGTEVEALLQNGVCPDDPGLQPVNQSADSPHSVFYSDTMQLCFGAPMTSPGADTDPLFDVPWWFRTGFSAGLASGQDAKLVINGVMGQADVWVNGTEVATEATVEGDYTSYSFDVTNLIRPGANSLALEVFPNDPNTMFTLDDVDWNQIPPDNNTGIQFPVQLHVSDALEISDTYVTQDDAPDMSSAALTVHADVSNTTAVPQAGTVLATITPPGGGAIQVSQPVTLPAHAAQTVTFTPARFGQLVVGHPQLWWPYQMGGQPLYTLRAAVTSGDGTSDAAPPADFGIRSVTTYLTPPSTMAPEGARVFEINGVPFDFRAGGWSENLFLHYSAADLASQITLIKSLGINGIRTEGKQMPQDFYDQMDRAGILIDAGFQCCDKWAPPGSGRGVTSQEYHVMYLSSLTIGEQLRDHPSVLNFSWSDNNPINEQETASLAGFSQSGFQDPIISSAEYNPAGILGPSGEKEGPYDWVPPSYWYDTSHSSNNAVDDDSTLTNVGGSWGFDSEQSAGDTVPTMDSIQRFLSPSDQAALWQQPDAHQYHANYESTDGSHSGYSFGTLDNLDTAIAARYGKWDSLAQYVEEAQVQNYEDTRAQFEAYIDHWDNYPTPSTGTDYWQLNKGWPTLLWDLYNYDYDQAGSYFGAKKANEDLHVLYAYDTGQVTVDNLSGAGQGGLSVESRVYDLSGQVLADQAAGGIAVGPQQVRNGVLTPRVPAATTPPTPAQTYFVELILRQHGAVVDRNVYWLSTQQDVLDWDTTEGNPQADNGSPLSQYADMTALQTLPSEPVQVAAATGRRPGPDGDDLVTSVTITNPASNAAVAFFLRADVRRGNADGTAQPGDNEVLPITWSDNDITLWPGESETLTASYRSSLLHGAAPVVSVYGWNVPDATFTAPQTSVAAAVEAAAAATAHVQHFGAADGTALTRGGARPGSGRPAALNRAASTPAGTTAGTAAGAAAGPALTVTSVAHSPDTTPSTSFTQGDAADTYTLTVTNSGRAPTDGKTPVTLTDIVDPNLNFVSAAGSGWTCDSSDNPTIICSQASGPGGAPAVLAPGQSYPPVTVTVQVPLGTGFGTQDSNDGLHVTNAALVAGGAPAAPSASLASPTPVVGVPGLTADNAVDGAFRQGDTGDRYEITVMNTGGAPTNGSAAAPITATVTVSAGQTIGDLYGSGWTCNLAAITAPRAEPADTCYRSDVLAGENDEEPPITVVVGVAVGAPATATETVAVDGGGNVGGPATVSATTAVAPAPAPPATGPVSPTPPVLTVTSAHAGSFAQGDASDGYTLTVSDAAAAGATSGTVTVTDSLPPGITPVEMTGSGWTCSLAPPTLPPTSSSRRNPVTNTYEPAPVCSRSDVLAPGSSYPPITLDVAVADNTQPSVTNTAAVYGGGSAVVGTGTDPTTVRQLPALAVFSYPSAGGVPYAPFLRGRGAADVYHVTVANDGYAPTSGQVSFGADLPPGLTAVSISAPPGWSCSLATATCATGSGVSLAAGQQDAITIEVGVAADAPVSAQAFFQASGGGQIPPAGLDTNNDYSTAGNGGEFTDPTYVVP